MRLLSTLILAGSLLSPCIVRADEDLGLCCLCEGCGPTVRKGFKVNADGKKCSELSLEMADPTNSSTQGSVDCTALQSKYRKTCCDPKYDPPAVAQNPTPAPNHGYATGPYNNCDICHDGSPPTKKYNQIFILKKFMPKGKYTCIELYHLGLTGNIHNQICNPLVDNAHKPCGCGLSTATSPTPSPTHQVQTPVPTKSPTQEPTREPTRSPTKQPTSVPTRGPTGSPTKQPTPVPTREPTGSPTKQPTPVPTQEPTASPTKQPTPAPTREPTGIPTGQPTRAPTLNPTQRPVGSPMERPTGAPTRHPTNLPVAPVWVRPVPPSPPPHVPAWVQPVPSPQAAPTAPTGPHQVNPKKPVPDDSSKENDSSKLWADTDGGGSVPGIRGGLKKKRRHH